MRDKNDPEFRVWHIASTLERLLLRHLWLSGLQPVANPPAFYEHGPSVAFGAPLISARAALQSSLYSRSRVTFCFPIDLNCGLVAVCPDLTEVPA
jgi:hypothetical protein